MLRFSLGAIPVTVRPTFWLVALLLGWSLANQMALLVVWVVVVFVSVLAHELGHALTARRYGADVSITLTTFGGFTRWSVNRGQMSPGRRALIAAAGSGVGIVLGLAVLGSYLLIRPSDPTVATVITLIVWVNVGWGVLNWLPIRPLDGGHMTLALLDLVAPKHADRIGTAVFVVTGAAALAAALYFELFFAAMLAGFMTWVEVSRRLPSSGSTEPIQFSYDDHPHTPRPELPARPEAPTSHADPPTPNRGAAERERPGAPEVPDPAPDEADRPE